MDHSLLAGCKLEECAELLDADNGSVEDLAFFEIRHDHLDHALRFRHTLRIVSADGDTAVVLDIDLYAGALDDLIDGLASLADHITDLLGINGHELDLRCIFVDGRTRLCDCILHHAVHDELAGILAAGNCAFHDGSGQTVDLDIHLNGGNAVMGSGHLEVHVAEEVFQTLDIGQQDKIVIGIARHQTAGNTCNLLLDRNAGCHQCHAACAGRSHGGGTVGFEGLGDRTDGIRELFHARKDRQKGSLSQCTVSDFTAARSSGDLGLTDGVCREVVLVQISLLSDVGIHALNALCLGKRAEGDNVTDLGLSAGEHGGAVHSRNNIHFRGKRADLRDFTAVRTLVILQDHLADGLLLILINCLVQNRKPLFLLGEGFGQLFGDLGDVVLSRLLVIREDGNFHLCRRDNLSHGCEQFFRNRAADVFLLRLSDFCHDVIDESDDLFVDLICLVDIGDHVRFRNFIRTGLDHDNLLGSGSDRQLQIALVPVILTGVYNDLAVHETDLGGCAGAVKRDIGNGCGNGRAQHGDQLRSACGIHAHNHALQRDIVAHILREQRSHRAVNNAAGEDRVLGRSAFPLVEAAGHLADGVELLAVLHAQREEIDAVTRLRGFCGGAQDSGVAVVHECTSVRLLAYPADINAQGAAAQFHGISFVV